jgi:DNA-binding NtrC family response regulator
MTDKPTLLLVDDEERILKSLKTTFKTRYQVLATTDAKQAITLVQQHKVHVVVSDQRMPIMPGTELLRNIRELSPNTMRILLTGYADLAAIVGSINEGEIFRYINKPWDNQEFKNIIANAMDIACKIEDLPTQAEQKQTAITAELEVLVIDSDPQTFASVTKIMQHTNNKVHWGQDLEQAFNLLTKHKNIAVLVTEVRIAQEDISNPLKILKQYHPNILTLVVTSFQDTQSLIKLINQGQIYRFLPKPVQPKMLERGLRDALWRYNFLRQVPKAIARHSVENTTPTISGTILHYLKNLTR